MRSPRRCTDASASSWRSSASRGPPHGSTPTRRVGRSGHCWRERPRSPPGCGIEKAHQDPDISAPPFLESAGRRRGGTLAATRVTGPPANGAPTEEFVEEWRNAAYSCFSSGHKFCREVCPVMQVTRDEAHTPTAFHANVVAMEKGHLGSRTSRGTTSTAPSAAPASSAARTRSSPATSTASARARSIWSRRCGRSPSTRASTSRRGSAGTSSPTRLGASRCSTAPRSRRTTSPTGPRPRPPRRRRDDPLLRLRGCVPPHVAAARSRARCCRRPESSSASCASSGAAAGRRPRWATSSRRGASPSTTSRTGAPSEHAGSSSSTPTTTSRSPRTTRRYFGDDFDFEIVLVVELLAELIREGRLELTTPVERTVTYHDACRLEQAEGDSRGAAGDPAGDPRPHLQGRRPRDAVVVLLGRGRRPFDRAPRPDGGDLAAADRQGGRSSRSTRSSPHASGRSGHSASRARARASRSAT